MACHERQIGKLPLYDCPQKNDVNLSLLSFFFQNRNGKPRQPRPKKTTRKLSKILKQMVAVRRMVVVRPRNAAKPAKSQRKRAKKPNPKMRMMMMKVIKFLS